MHRVVVFTEDNARVLYTDTPQLWEHTPQAVIEPDLKEVTGVAPHFWKLVDGKVVPMNDVERASRKDYHLRYVAVNSLPKPHLKLAPKEEAILPPIKVEENYTPALYWTFAGMAALAVIIYGVLKWF